MEAMYQGEQMKKFILIEKQSFHLESSIAIEKNK